MTSIPSFIRQHLDLSHDPNGWMRWHSLAVWRSTSWEVLVSMTIFRQPGLKRSAEYPTSASLSGRDLDVWSWHDPPSCDKTGVTVHSQHEASVLSGTLCMSFFVSQFYFIFLLPAVNLLLDATRIIILLAYHTNIVQLSTSSFLTSYVIFRRVLCHIFGTSKNKTRV